MTNKLILCMNDSLYILPFQRNLIVLPDSNITIFKLIYITHSSTYASKQERGFNFARASAILF